MNQNKGAALLLALKTRGHVFDLRLHKSVRWEFKLWPHLDMTLAVIGTLSTNKQSNKQKETNKKTLNFSMMSYGITSTIMGSGSILLNQKPKNGFQWSEKKRNTSLSYQKTPNWSNKDKKIDSSKKFSHNYSALNLITYVDMCISSTLAAILMTSSFGPDTDLRCVNWFKLLHMPQNLFWYRSQKIVTKFTRDSKST